MTNRRVATQMGQPVQAPEFWRDAMALAARLPGHAHVVNLCTHRYRFMVGLAAALVRRQLTLLPMANVPGDLAALAQDYPNLYALTDGAEPGLPSMAYPDDLKGPLPSSNPLPSDDQPAVVLFTSGSTGRPKPAQKSWSTLRHSVQAAGVRLGIAEFSSATIIGTVPHHHSYGLESVILLGLLHGITIDTGWPLYPADIRSALARAMGPRILVTTPLHLRALLAEPQDMPRADLILSATAPLSPELAAQAEVSFGARLIEIYGCTEAGQIATRRTARERQWHCRDGVALHLDEAGTWASGPAVAGPKTLLHDSIELTGPATFHLGERTVDMIDIAGKRNSLAYLNHQLLGIPGVEDGVFVMGQAGRNVARLAALAVAPGLSSAQIMAALRERIDAAFLPRPLVLVNQLPRNILGKLSREELLRLIPTAEIR